MASNERPFPIFGVLNGDVELTHAHVFDNDQRTSMCGFWLRPMETVAETELPTCQACAQETKSRG